MSAPVADSCVIGTGNGQGGSGGFNGITIGPLFEGWFNLLAGRPLLGPDF
jgi:hypothetical protein